MAEITTLPRGLVVEVPIDADAGVDESSVINCDGLHTVSQRRLRRRIGLVGGDVLDEACAAIAAALGCNDDERRLTGHGAPRRPFTVGDPAGLPGEGDRE